MRTVLIKPCLNNADTSIADSGPRYGEHTWSLGSHREKAITEQKDLSFIKSLFTEVDF